MLRPMSRERRPSFVEAGSRTGSRAGSRPGGSRGWRISRSMLRAASPTLKSGDEAALAALRVPPAQRSVEEHAAVRRWSERSVRLPGRTTHEELCTVMTLEEHPPPYDPQANGAIEVGVKLVKGHLKTMRSALEERI